VAKGGRAFRTFSEHLAIPTTAKKSNNFQIVEPFAELSSFDYNIATTKAKLEGTFKRK
jgi:hypothetical protein